MDDIGEDIGSLLGHFAPQLGLGELPEGILDDENRRLHEELKAVQTEHAKLVNEGHREDDKLQELLSHVQGVEEACESARALLKTKEEELVAEKNLAKIASMLAKRTSKEREAHCRALESTEKQAEDLTEKIKSRLAVLDLLDEEHLNDLGKLDEWSRHTAEFEDNIFALLKCHHDDEIKIKSLHLKLERLREVVGKRKAELDESSTMHRMSQVALDKTAEEYRQLHAERQAVVERWEAADRVVKVRDAELKQLFEKVNNAKEKARKKAAALEEQVSFLGTEQQNLDELQHNIQDLERRATSLAAELAGREKALETVEGELVLEERETMKLGSSVASHRTRLKETKAVISRANDRVMKLEGLVGEAEEKIKSMYNSNVTAEGRIKELESLLQAEEKRRDLVHWELDRIREKKLKAEEGLKKMEGEEEAVGLEVYSLRTEKSNLSKRIKATKEELVKKEDVAVTSNYRIIKLEREIAELKGEASAQQKSDLKSDLAALKIQLDESSSDRRNIDHLVHKVEADVRKVSREVDKMTGEKKGLKEKLDGAVLAGETGKKMFKHLQDQIEAKVLEEKLLMVNEKKVKEEIESLNASILDLENQELTNKEEARKQKVDLECQRQVLVNRQKHMNESLRCLRSEVRERKDAATKMKAKYELLVKSLGGSSKDTSTEEEIPSHAHHLIRLAQQKAELHDEGEHLERKLREQEKELLGLEQAMAMLRNSNEKYRAENFHRDALGSSELGREMKEKVKAKADRLEELKNELNGLQAETKLKESELAKCIAEAEQQRAFFDERHASLSRLEREVKEQSQRLARAQKVNATLSKALTSSVPDSEHYERDMDLRTEKECQRNTLLKLREFSTTDQKFLKAYEALIQRLGLHTPSLSRLEASASARSRSSRRSGSLSRGSSSSTGRREFQRKVTSSGRSRSGNSIRRFPSSPSVLVMELSDQKSLGFPKLSGRPGVILPVVN